MKKKILLVAMMCFAFIALTSEIASDNGIAGRTGSPGESTCTGCHNDFALNSGGGSVSVSSNIPNWEYTPGVTYTINVKVARTGNPLFGLDLEALNTSYQNAGTLIVTNSKTQILTKTVSSVVRNNMVHTLNGGISNDSMIFSFNWAAPATDIGNVTLYFAGLAADADQSTAGDYVYTSTKLITPALSTGIGTNTGDHLLNVFPNPASSYVTLSFSLTEADQVTVNLFSINGELVECLVNEWVSAGSFTKTFDFQRNHSPGMYFLQLQLKNNTITKKIVIE